MSSSSLHLVADTETSCRLDAGSSGGKASAAPSVSDVPQLKQNFLDASLGVAQLGQTLPRGFPLLEQKAWLAGFSVPQFPQLT